jgi:hypothetical protein
MQITCSLGLLRYDGKNAGGRVEDVEELIAGDGGDGGKVQSTVSSLKVRTESLQYNRLPSIGGLGCFNRQTRRKKGMHWWPCCSHCSGDCHAEGLVWTREA